MSRMGLSQCIKTIQLNLTVYFHIIRSEGRSVSLKELFVTNFFLRQKGFYLAVGFLLIRYSLYQFLSPRI